MEARVEKPHRIAGYCRISVDVEADRDSLGKNWYIFLRMGKEISSRGENMEMCVDHQLHLVSIWLPNDEKDVAILEPVYRKYKGTPYRVAVFRSGKGNLLTNTAALLKANR